MNSLSQHLETFAPLHLDNARKVKISLKISDVIANLEFLKEIDDNGHLFYEESYVRNSIRRYERFWIPMIIKLSDNEIDDLLYEPPLGKYFISLISSTLKNLFIWDYCTHISS